MKTLYLAFAIGAGAFPLYCQAGDFDVRTGAWETTSTTTMAGVMIPKAALMQMPPAQRAKVEAMMQARAGKANTHTSIECVTQQDLDRGRLMKSDEANCTRRIIAQSAHHLEMEQTCSGPEGSTSRFVLDAESPTRYSSSVDVARTEGGKVHVTIDGRWLGATCPKGAR